METEKIIDFLKAELSEYRFRHTMGVADTAKDLAQKYGENEEVAYIAGLLHDIAKELSLDKLLNLAEKYNADPDEITKTSSALMHGLIGAYMAREKFGVEDKIFDAIKYHTTGKANMSLFTKIIYIADYIEPNRCMSGVEAARELAYSSIDDAILMSLSTTIIHTVNKGGIVHPSTVEARNYLLLHNRSGAENEEIFG